MLRGGFPRRDGLGWGWPPRRGWEAGLVLRTGVSQRITRSFSSLFRRRRCSDGRRIGRRRGFWKVCRTGGRGFRWGFPPGTSPKSGGLGAGCRGFDEMDVFDSCGSLGRRSRGRWPGGSSVGAVGLVSKGWRRSLLSYGVSGGGRFKPGPGGHCRGRFRCPLRNTIRSKNERNSPV